MKRKCMILCMLLIGAATIISSCKKDDDPAPKPTPPTTGGLSIDVRLLPDSGITQTVFYGVEVRLATSQANLDSSIYLQTKISSAQTNYAADFGQLDPGTYYYDCFFTHISSIDTVDYYGAGQAQIVAGKDLALTLDVTEQ